MSLKLAMEKKIQSDLTPVHWELLNESHMHSVAPGSETHFKLLVVSPRFEGMNMVLRHRMLYELFGSEMKQGVHALSLQTFTPTEWEKKKSVKLESPPCHGGSKS